MNDTPPDVDAMYQEMLMQRSGSERVRMGTSMFDTARAFMRASLREQGLVEGTVEWSIALLARTYGDEISSSTLAAVERHLRQQER